MRFSRKPETQTLWTLTLVALVIADIGFGYWVWDAARKPISAPHVWIH